MKKLLAKIVVFVSTMAMAVGISSVMASASVTYELRAGITVGQVMQRDTYLGTGDYFTVVTGGNAMTIDGNPRSYIYDQATNVVTHIENASQQYKLRLKTSGQGDITRRNVAFTTSGHAVVDIYAINGSTAADAANRSLTIAKEDGSEEGAVIQTGLCAGSTKATFEGKEVSVVRKSTVDLAEAGTYHIFCKDGSFSIYDIVVTEDSAAAETPLYWAQPVEMTPSTTLPYPDPESIITTSVTKANVLNNEVSAENHYGIENSQRIRLGADVHKKLYPNAYNSDNINTVPASIESCGFITFKYSGDFNLNITAASSGSTSSREIFFGEYDETQEGDARFSIISSGTVTGNVGESIVCNVTGDDTEKTYAVYVMPYNKGTSNGEPDDIIDPAENTDIRSIEIVSGDGAYYTTPSLTLETPQKNGNEVTVKGKFNKFNGDAFEVYQIWICGTTGQTEQNLAVWLGGADDDENQMINLTKDPDGTVSFTAVFKNEPNGEATIPTETVKLQAHALYDGIIEDVQGSYQEEIVSNAVRYVAE